MQCKELIKPWDPVPTPVPRQQEELNVASNILKALHSTGGLFDQPATRTIDLSACLHVNFFSSAFHTWGQPTDTNSHPDTPPHPLPADNSHASTHTLSYINELEDNIRNALMHEDKLDIQKPEPFHGRDPCKWRTFLTQCLTMFQAKPLTFQLESSHVAFAASYLQGITFNHYMALLQFDLNSPVLFNWQAFAQEFSSEFGVFDTVVEAEENLFNLWMCNNKQFII
ncbi:hypothetical protein C0993_007289 [Termitomyces sp. T159_Od127]|nr:hypothetical protein C0993_007289 [Termitomyces sp. T159_Od127]